MSKKTHGINSKDFALEVAQQAIKGYVELENKKKKDYRFRNTKLLLKNYNSLKDHLANAKDNIHELNDVIDVEEIKGYNQDELYINSIRRSKLKTVIILAHIEASMAQLKLNMIEKGQLEKYSVIEEIYLNSRTYEKVAEDVSCTSITVRRWEKEMINELSVLLFGVDGLKIDK